MCDQSANKQTNLDSNIQEQMLVPENNFPLCQTIRSQNFALLQEELFHLWREGMNEWWVSDEWIYTLFTKTVISKLFKSIKRTDDQIWNRNVEKT